MARSSNQFSATHVICRLNHRSSVPLINFPSKLPDAFLVPEKACFLEQLELARVGQFIASMNADSTRNPKTGS